MHEFHYRNSHLYCEKVRVEDLAQKFGTPLYVYSYKTLIDHLTKLQRAFRSVEPLICYSVKANSNLAILKALVEKGAGLDIVSGGELYRARLAGCPPEKIVYASVGKADAEITEAIRNGILFFNAESLPELGNIDRIAASLKKVVRIAIRINPAVEPKTHKFITTGKITDKFGIDLESALRVLSARCDFPNLNFCAIHIHIGSQITEAAPFVEAIKKVLKFIKVLAGRGLKIEYLNIGGGLGIIYNDEKPQTALKYARRILPCLLESGLKIIMEPGRFIAGNAGILVTKVLYVKTTPRKRFVIVDAGMNDLIRPALYGAYHMIQPLRKTTNGRMAAERVDIVGPICESGDFLAKERVMPRVAGGDHLAAMSAGAYGFSMSSNYNSRRRPAEVMVAGERVFVIRKRESMQDLVRNEVMPAPLLGL